MLENADENLTPRMRNLVAMLWSEWKDLELQIVQMNDEVERIASSDAARLRLRQIPGSGAESADPAGPWSPRCGVAIETGPNRDGCLDDLA